MWCGLMVNPNLIGNGEHQVFINARNLLQDDDYEFIFGDRVGSEFLIGLSLKWGKVRKKQP